MLYLQLRLKPYLSTKRGYQQDDPFYLKNCNVHNMLEYGKQNVLGSSAQTRQYLLTLRHSHLTQVILLHFFPAINAKLKKQDMHSKFFL